MLYSVTENTIQIITIRDELILDIFLFKLLINSIHCGFLAPYVCFFSHPFTLAKRCRSVLISKTRLREIMFINFKVILKLFWIRLVSYSHAENEGGRGENYTRTNISLHSVYLYECYILIRLIYLQYSCDFINKFNIFGNYWQFECALLKGRLLLIAKKKQK